MLYETIKKSKYTIEIKNRLFIISKQIVATNQSYECIRTRNDFAKWLNTKQ